MKTLWDGLPGPKLWRLGEYSAAPSEGVAAKQDIDHAWQDDGDHLGHIISPTHYAKVVVSGDDCVGVATTIVAMLNARDRRTLKDVLPAEFTQGEYSGTDAFKLRDAIVAAVFGANTQIEAPFLPSRPWPGPHRHVSMWVLLDNGKSVAWNDNPNHGWSFPVINYPTKQRHFGFAANAVKQVRGRSRGHKPTVVANAMVPS